MSQSKGDRPVSVWTQGMDKTQKEDFYAMLKGSTPVLLRLQDLVDEQMEKIWEEEANHDYRGDYPSWQASKNGEKKTIFWLNKLLQHLPKG